MATATYIEAAKQIADELDRRGFATDNPNGADNLIMVMADIIRKTLQGNTNFTGADSLKESELAEDKLVEAEMEEMIGKILGKQNYPPLP